MTGSVTNKEYEHLNSIQTLLYRHTERTHTSLRSKNKINFFVEEKRSRNFQLEAGVKALGLLGSGSGARQGCQELYANRVGNGDQNPTCARDRANSLPQGQDRVPLSVKGVEKVLEDNLSYNWYKVASLQQQKKSHSRTPASYSGTGTQNHQFQVQSETEGPWDQMEAVIKVTDRKREEDRMTERTHTCSDEKKLPPRGVCKQSSKAHENNSY